MDRYDKAIQDAASIAEENDIPFTFETPRRGRKRSLISAEEAFKTDFFEFMIDTAKESITERFEILSAHSTLYAFLYEFNHLEERYANGELLISCKKLENGLKRGEVSDIDANELFNELRIVARLIRANKPIGHVIDVLNLIAKNKLENLLPNTVIAYRILLTIPVSVATGERTFSKMKPIKTY